MAPITGMLIVGLILMGLHLILKKLFDKNIGGLFKGIVVVWVAIAALSKIFGDKKK